MYVYISIYIKDRNRMNYRLLPATSLPHLLEMNFQHSCGQISILWAFTHTLAISFPHVSSLRHNYWQNKIQMTNRVCFPPSQVHL